AEKLVLLQCAAANVSPSMYEGFGLSVLESMACGVPVIAANRTSLPEVVGDAGLLVEPDRVALSAAIYRLLTDADLHADLASRALARAQTFSWQRCAAETLAVYRSVLA
ncbi:MAG TPA: glycosyltransferase, partial [Thermomicrobiales bacterium]|nr:glycosyltransferase [Thermomicrobiales bacterium]